jgi:hypothetical protein
MFSIDDRAGNVVTTVALFLVGATILYIGRGAFLIVSGYFGRRLLQIG